MNAPSRERLSEALETSDLAALAGKLTWAKKRLEHQREPAGDWWTIWLMLAGRGAGKTRTAAETLWQWAWARPDTRWLVSAPTYNDLEAVCFEGESGLLAVTPRQIVEKYTTNGQPVLRLRNGSQIIGITAEKPERFRGPQFHGGWLDELAAWQYLQEAWDLLMMGMRLGTHPRLVCTTTPKPVPLLRDLVGREGDDVVITRATTYDNLSNLAPTFKKQILKYEGTKIGRQEIHAELIDPTESGIIRRSWVQMWPKDQPLPPFDIIIMSLDTAYTEETRDKKSGDADFTACTVWGLFRRGKEHGMLLLDAWQERLGLPDLVDRVKQELRLRYGGEEQRPVIQPLFGPKRLHEAGKPVDLVIIEDKGSGISLRQFLGREGIDAYAYNPGRTKKLERLHMVSHLFNHGLVWMPESDKRPGHFRNWCEPVLDQLTMFTGEGSIRHDDFVDATTQALRYLADRDMISVTEPDYDDDVIPFKKPANPYAA